jgi:hypothetical protein
MPPPEDVLKAIRRATLIVAEELREELRTARFQDLTPPASEPALVVQAEERDPEHDLDWELWHDLNNIAASIEHLEQTEDLDDAVKKIYTHGYPFEVLRAATALVRAGRRGHR